VAGAARARGLWENVPLKFRARKFAASPKKDSPKEHHDKDTKPRKTGFLKHLFSR
jgi:hypothetical protein